MLPRHGDPDFISISLRSFIYQVAGTARLVFVSLRSLTSVFVRFGNV